MFLLSRQSRYPGIRFCFFTVGNFQKQDSTNRTFRSHEIQREGPPRSGGESMRVAAKGLVLALGLVALPATASVMAGMRFSGAHPLGATEDPMTNMTYRVKDQSRMDLPDQPFAPVAFAQLGEAPVPPPPGAFWRMPHPPGGIDSMGLPGFVPPRPALPLRQACEEEIHRRAAVAGYLGAKLRLQGAQREAWQNVVSAAAPAVEALYCLCAELPERIAARPSMPDVISYEERRLSATSEFLRVIREPFRALYETLSADQRAALEPPPPPLPPPPM
jgi:hypothetical protein